MKKVHLVSPIQRGAVHTTACNRKLAGLEVATDMAKVTCKWCLELVRSGKFIAEERGKPLEITDRYTEREIRFASHPLVVANAKLAAREAGYSDSAANSEAHEMRRRLWPLISKIQGQRLERIAVSKDKVLAELAHMGFANILDYVHVDEETGKTIPKQLHELTRDEAAAIKSYKIDFFEFENKETGEIRKFHALSHIELFDKRSALIDLGKAIGMFNEKLQLIMRTEDTEKRRDIRLADLPTDALEKLQGALLEAMDSVSDAVADTRALPGEGAVIHE